MKQAGLILLLLAVCAGVSGANETTREVSIIARRFEYLPGKIKVERGRPVKLYLTSLDTTHGFYLEAFDINQRIEKGNLTVVEFTPEKAGKFPFSCSVFCGLGHMGMTGEIIVVEPMAETSPATQMPKMKGIKMQGMEEMMPMQHRH